jgi:hypothetical protein
MGRAPALIALALAACDVPASTPDAAIDANLVDFTFTGTFLDWDSPCPIAGATWTATYDDQRTTMTDATGSFTLALASYTALVDVTPPSEPSTCAGGTYSIPGIAIAPPAVSLANGVVVARSMTQARAATFYVSIGAPFDPTRGNLLIHVNGTPRAFAIAEPHATAQAFNGTAWAAGDTGADVFFPNIAIPLSKRATVTVAGGNAIGLGAVQLAPGTITFMTVILR